MHCHILPGLDDGARDDEAALDMLRIAERDGILTIVATPHSHHTTVDAICRQLVRVKQLARSAGIAVDILPGSEVRIAADLVERYRAGELLTLNGTQYLLLELHLFHDWALEAILSVVERLVDAGLRPLLAHPERHRWVQHDPALVDRLRDAGVTLQVNAPSLFGGHGDAAQATAEFLIATHRAGVIASDAHNAGRRSPQLSAAY
ncbi:MAG: tyrosine-protein phosphatase, partial [Chloroflexota bacterium]